MTIFSRFNRPKPSDLMADTPLSPEARASRERVRQSEAAYFERGGPDPIATNERQLQKYGGGTGTSSVPVGTIMVEEPGAATRAMTDVGGSNLRTIDGIPVQASDTKWTGEQVRNIMSPEGVGRAAAVATRPQSVAEQLLGDSTRALQSESTVSQPQGLFYDENHFQASDRPKDWLRLQADAWTRTKYEPNRAYLADATTLDEYDRRFREISQGAKPEWYGDTMKSAWLAGMSPAVSAEYSDRVHQTGVERRDKGAAAAFTAAGGPAVKTMDEAKAATAGAALKQSADEASRQERELKLREDAAVRAKATEAWDAEPIGKMKPVDGVPGWGFVKTSTGGGQLVELPQEKKIPFDGRKSFTVDNVLWTWNDKSQSYMGRPQNSKTLDVDPMIWLTMTPEQQQALVDAATTGKKAEATAERKPPQPGKAVGDTARDKKTGKTWTWNGKTWE